MNWHLNLESITLLRPHALYLLIGAAVVLAWFPGQEFGNARWIEAIRALPDWGAAESLQFLMKRVDDFVGLTRQSDDITCLVIRTK